MASSSLPAAAGKDLRNLLKASGLLFLFRRSKSFACFFKWSKLGFSGNGGIETSMLEMPKVRNAGCIKVQKTLLAEDKWVQPFPRTRMRLAPQGHDNWKSSTDQAGDLERLPQV